MACAYAVYLRHTWLQMLTENLDSDKATNENHKTFHRKTKVICSTLECDGHIIHYPSSYRIVGIGTKSYGQVKFWTLSNDLAIAFRNSRIKGQ